MVPNVPAPLPSGERLERLVPPPLTGYIHFNDLYDIALWGPRDLGFAAWVIKTAKAPVPASTPCRDLCLYPCLSAQKSAPESSGYRGVGRQRTVDLHQSHCLPPVILSSPQGDELSALGVFVCLHRVTARYDRVGGLLNVSTQDQVQLGFAPEQVAVGVGALVSDGH